MQRTLLIRGFERISGMVERLLEALPEEVMRRDVSRDTEFFTVVEQIIHITQLIKFAMSTVGHQVLGEPEDERLRKSCETLRSLSPAEAHATLSAMNLVAARSAATAFRSLQEVQGYWGEVHISTLEHLYSLSEEDLSSRVVHRTTDEEGTAFEFLTWLFCVHVAWHLGQATLQLRHMGYPAPSPLKTGKPETVPGPETLAFPGTGQPARWPLA